MCLADKIAHVMRRGETVMVTDEEGELQGLRRLLYLFYNLQVMRMGKMYATILCAIVQHICNIKDAFPLIMQLSFHLCVFAPAANI